MSSRLQRFFDTVQSWPRIIRWPLGALCLILGVLGIILPFLQGFLFLLIGIILFGLIEQKDLEKIRERMQRFKERFLASRKK
jgi:uncharacterized membrane protein YbaN (DUF454 family)